MISLGPRLIACCKLAPTLAKQMWRHNYDIDRNEYLVFALSESINPWVYSLQFLFKSTNNSWRYERKCEWVFFLNTVTVYFIYNFYSPKGTSLAEVFRLIQILTKFGIVERDYKLYSLYRLTGAGEYKFRGVLVICYTGSIFTARCTTVQSAVLRSHVVCPSVCL